MTDIHSSADAYVVGALAPDEVTEFEGHMSECADCRAEVSDARELTAQLSEAVTTEPPPALRGSVLALIATTPQASAEPVQAVPAPTPMPAPARAAGRHAAPRPAGEAVPDTTLTRPTDISTKRRSWAVRASALVAAAAVIAAVAIGWTAIESRNDARDETTAAQLQLERLASVLTAADVQTAAARVANGGDAVVVRSVDEGMALLFTAGLPDLPDSKVYQAWTFDGDTPVPAGTFTAEPAEPSTSVQLPPAGVDTSTVAVTVEPEGGSDAPTTAPIAVIDLST